MFDKIQAVELRFEEINQLLMDPSVVGDNNRYRDLMKEYRNIEPIVEKYREYAKAKEALEEAKMMLDEGGLDKEFKEMVVREYLNGNSSTRDLCIKYEIPSHQTLLKWVNSYNGHEELKDYNPKGDVYMTKSRKTTLEERNEIVQYCLEHNKEYKLAAEHFDVSYAQVYQWVQKYLKSGEDGLIDNRGKRKDESQLSELERLRRENERLKRQLELKEREEIILKKLQEVERRRYSPKGNRNRSI